MGQDSSMPWNFQEWSNTMAAYLLLCQRARERIGDSGWAFLGYAITI